MTAEQASWLIEAIRNGLNQAKRQKESPIKGFTYDGDNHDGEIIVDFSDGTEHVISFTWE